MNKEAKVGSGLQIAGPYMAALGALICSAQPPVSGLSMPWRWLRYIDDGTYSKFPYEEGAVAPKDKHKRHWRLPHRLSNLVTNGPVHRAARASLSALARASLIVFAAPALSSPPPVPLKYMLLEIDKIFEEADTANNL